MSAIQNLNFEKLSEENLKTQRKRPKTSSVSENIHTETKRNF